jgi:hypothetical protein
MLQAQIVTGTVVDARTRAPLAYVHIGIVNRGVGVISDEWGRFRFPMANAFRADTLTFSMIGYTTTHKVVASLTEGDNKIAMEPSITQLKEVVIHDKKREQLKFGRVRPTKTTTGASGIKDYGIGKEVGTTIKNDGHKYYINAINFHQRWNTVDSILYRINIYTLKNELPDTSILQKAIFVMAYKRDKWVTKQLEAEVILFDRDLFVSIELIRRWNNDGDNLLFYSHGEGQRDCKSYIRPTSLAQWTTNFAIPLTLHLTVEKFE